MSIDWKKGPGYKSIKAIEVPEYKISYLDNGIKVIEINKGTQDIIKMDIIFEGGRILEDKKLTSRFATSLMREGTQSYTSSKIAEQIDYLGASLRSMSNLDFCYFSLSCLSKHFEDILPILNEIIEKPTFSDSELNKFKKSILQKLKLDAAKSEIMAYRVFTEQIFGKNHPYGYNTSKELVESLTREDILKYFVNYFGSSNCTIILAGKIKPQFLKKINALFGGKKQEIITKIFPLSSLPLRDDYIEQYSSNEYQAALKIGRKLFNRHHEDYPELFVLNTVFGGYFGSRLMRSIREEKGYTYNIYSAIDHMIYDGYFYVGTEVGLDSLDLCREEIYNQMNVLQEDLIGDKEMGMVRNYLLGNFLNLVDGPLNTSSLVRSLEVDNFGTKAFNDFIEKISSTTPQRLRDLAQKYWKKEDMLTVVIRKEQES